MRRKPRAFGGLGFSAVITVMATMLKTLSAYLSDYFTIPMRNGIVRDVRNDMYAKILSLPIGFYTNERKGDVMARLSGDVSRIEWSVMSSVNMLFKNPVQILIYLAMMVYVSWELTIFVLVFLPIAGTVMGRWASSSNARRVWRNRCGAIYFPPPRRPSPGCALSRRSMPKIRWIRGSQAKLRNITAFPIR